MLVKDLIKESLEEVINELGNELEGDEITSSDLALGDISAKLAQAKGELNTILDRAAREGIIAKNDGKISIRNREEYMKRVGGLPKRIKNLQKQLEPSTSEDNLD